MKKYILLTLIVTNATLLFAQNVGINGDNSQPDASAMLDIKSSDKGLLIPRIKLNSISMADPVANPATGLLVYANDSSSVEEGYYYWNGSQWMKLITGEGITDNDCDSTNELQTLDKVLKRGNSAENQRVTNLADPISAQDAATKNYVDNNDEVNDGDTNTTNEIQTLSINGNDLTISGSGGNTVTLPSASSFSLPYSYSGEQGELDIEHTGTTDLAEFEINNSANSGNVLRLETNGSGHPLKITNLGTSDGIYIDNDGTDCAININNSSNSDRSIRIKDYSSGSGPAVEVYQYGTGDCGNFKISNSSNSDDALYASTNGTGYAARFSGDVYVNGYMTFSGAKPFTIDHPLDPENKILRHFSIESPEIINMYKGRAKLVNGIAIIYLPDYFESLNHQEGREINLTPINGWSPLYLEGNIENNQFIIKTTEQGNPNQEFSWIIYAIRNDAYIKDHPIKVEEEKGDNSRFKKGELIYKGKE